MFVFCRENIHNIQFYNIRKDEVDVIRLRLAERFSKASSIPGTRSFHHFIPENNFSIKYKRFSKDENCTHFNVQIDNTTPAQDMTDTVATNLQAMDYIGCMYL